VRVAREMAGRLLTRAWRWRAHLPTRPSRSTREARRRCLGSSMAQVGAVAAWGGWRGGLALWAMVRRFRYGRETGID